MPKHKKLLLLVCVTLLGLISKAQTSVAATSSNDTGFMRSEGKIYVVMAVVIMILAGILIYMLRLDRKISKLEKGENT
ncbi:MAG TPA: hypothetical protein VLJ41_12145 [Segetibacter sp.]|nr:hypothetical protein [Segetibacter sp.]